MKNRKIKVAFIGAGKMALEHIKVFHNIKSVELVGIYSRTKLRASKLAKIYGIKNVVNSINNLYFLSKPDLVVVVVNAISMNKVSLQCLKYKWICLFEKPIALNYLEAKKIYQFSKKNKAKSFIALNRRQFDSTKNLLKILKKYKEKRIVIVNDQEDQFKAKKNGNPKKITDNWMYANSIHIIDYFKLLCRGKIKKITPINKWKKYEISFVSAKIEFTSGDIGFYNCIWNSPSFWSVNVNIKKYNFELKPLEKLVTLDPFFNKKVISNKNNFEKKFKPGIYSQALEAIKAVKCQKHNLASLKDNLETVHLISKLYNR